MKKNKKVSNIILFRIVLAVIFFCTIVFLYKPVIKKYEMITLNSNEGVPYTWEFAIEDETIARIKDITSKKISSNETTGGEKEVSYTFEGLKKGSTVVIFRYTNFTNNFVEKTKKYKITVDKNKNIDIIEID